MAATESTELRPFIGAAIGTLIALFDLALLRVIGVHMDLAGRDVTLPVLLLFGATFAALGYVNGKLLVARSQARQDADTIAQQLRALEQTQAQMLQVEKLASIGRMAAGVAHEVRNPLGVIGSSASLLEEMLAPDDADGLKAARFIREEVARLDGFVRSLLDFSRPLRSAPRSCSLAALVERVEQLSAEVVAEHQVTLEWACTGEGGWLDLDLVSRALLTLITNACQATPGGRVCVTLSEQPEQLLISVADDGPGIDETIADRLFDPFVTTRAKGTGLGLSMAARIVQSHGAELVVVPGAGLGADGRGACFRFCLPARALEEAA